MIIKDIAMFFPNTFISTILKFSREDIEDKGKQEILKNGLYHITKNEETAKKIIESQYLRPARGVGKNINSYGTACVCLFNGTPSVENYMRNLVYGQSKNPYINPTIVENAIKILPTKKEELTNYKVRALSDNAIIYEGYCILPQEETKIVQLVPDLVRNLETGEPIINPKTGRYDVAFREAQPEELEQDKKNYKAKEDYLQFMAQERERLGYLKGNNYITNLRNSIRTILHLGRIEGEVTYQNVIANIPQILKTKIKQLMNPKLDMGTDEKIHDTINEFNTKKKNPYRDKKFGEAVAEFQVQGLPQLELKDLLEDLTTSDIGEFFRKKCTQIDKSTIIPRGIHGITHNNRVAILTMLIAQKENIFDNDLDDRTKDILISAAYYHDIGRKKGIITDNFGPHSKNSVRKIKKMDLRYANGERYSPKDRCILQAVVEAHEGNDEDMFTICEKHKINEADIDYVKKLMAILKDADALDRVRTDKNLPILMQTDLKPKYLRTNTSKQLLNASYQLEILLEKVSFDRVIAYKTNEQKEGGIIESKREKFVEGLRKGIIEMPQTLQSVKRTIQLKKEQYSKKFNGKNIMNQIKRIINRQKKETQEKENVK